MRSIAGLLPSSAEQTVHDGRERPPLGRELLLELLSLRPDPVVTARPAVLETPAALEQALSFEPAEEGIERPLVDLEGLVGEPLLQRVAVLLAVQLGQDREHERAAPELEREAVPGRRLCGTCHHVVPYTVYHTVCQGPR